jgi:hypothetical protein
MALLHFVHLRTLPTFYKISTLQITHLEGSDHRCSRTPVRSDVPEGNVPHNITRGGGAIQMCDQDMFLN